MGINLVPRIPLESIGIQNRVFSKDNPHDEHDFEDNCITEGQHRILKFDFFCHNIGNKDFVAGDPRTQPDKFTKSKGHTHYHVKDFNKFILYKDGNRKEIARSLKQSFCLTDMVPLSFPLKEWQKLFSLPAKFNCLTRQGISAGWADVYRRRLPCQYIEIDDLPTGDYVLVAETNAERKNHTHIFEVEDNYSDNALEVRLRIGENDVRVTGGMLSSISPVILE
jgi:hypothetical protein